MKLKTGPKKGECHVESCSNASQKRVVENGQSMWLCEEHLQNELSTELAVHKNSLEEEIAVIQSFEISDPGDVAFAEKELLGVKKWWKEYEAKRTAATGPLNKSLKEINGWFKPVQTLLKRSEAAWKQKLVDHKMAQEEKQALLLEAANKMAEEEEHDTEEIKETLIAASDAVPQTEKVIFIDRWVFEIEDIRKVPLEYLVVDEKKVGKIVRALKDKATIPGIRVWNDQTVRA